MDPRPGIQQARRLRRDQTEAEARLWRHLRNSAIEHAKFHRQHQIGSYTADFACIELGLVIELDGSQHSDRNGHDEKRASDMATQGFVTIRFWNDDITQNLEGVLHTITTTIRRLRSEKVR